MSAPPSWSPCVLVGVSGLTASANGSQLSATAGDVGKRWTVCAQDLTVRDAPGGQVIGTLYGPQTGGRPAETFTIHDAGPGESGGEWVRGHAWGNVNRDGYVQNGRFCSDNAPGASTSPSAAPAPTAPQSATTAPTATAATAVPGCKIYAPDAHIISGRKLDVDYLFRCDNPRIRYVKVTLNIKRHRAGWADSTVKSYQFDNFSDPAHAGINSSLQGDGRCKRGRTYHGDITINVSLNANQQYTESRRSSSVKCP